MNHISHAKLKHRKAICAKTIFFKWLSGYEIELARINPKGCSAITDWWVPRCDNELIKVRDNVTLSHFLKELINDFEAQYNYYFQRENAIKYFNILKSKVHAIDCNKCSPRICDGSIGDNDICSEGQCFDSFIKIFYWTKKITLEKYEKYSLIFPKKNVPDLIFCTNSSIKKPHEIDISVFIASKLEFVDHPPNGISRIVLVFNTGSLSRDCLYYIPYMLFHECVAHAYKSTVGPKGYKRGKDFPLEHEPYNPFDEGWMDYVAYRIILKILDEIWREKRDCPDEIDISLIEKYKNATQFILSARESQQNYVADQESADYWNRYLGYGAARRFERFLKKFPGTKALSWNYFLQTSFDFNLLALNNKQKEKIPEIIYDLLSAQSTEEDLSPEQIERLRRFTDAFRKYFEGAPIYVFFDELEKIVY